MSAGYRLGIHAGAPAIPTPRTRLWPDAPEHTDETCTERITLSFTALVYEVLYRAAEHVGLSEPRFAVGATFRYVSDLRKHPQLLTAGAGFDPAGRPSLSELAAIELPAKYLT